MTLRTATACFLFLLSTLAGRSQTYPVKDNATCQYGLKSPNGEWIVAPIYESIYESENGYLVVEGGSFGVIDFKGNVLLPTHYFRLDELLGHYYRTETEDGRKGLIDITGKVHLPNEYESIEYFNSPGFQIMKDGLYGVYIPGKALVEPHYHRISNLIGNLMVIGPESDYSSFPIGLVNLQGDTVAPIVLDFFPKFEETGLCPIHRPDLQKTGIIDTNGTIVVDYEWESIASLHSNKSGPWIAEKAGKFGLLSQGGATLAKPQFSRIQPSYPDIPIIAKKGKRVGLINDEGKWITPTPFDSIAPLFWTSFSPKYTFRVARYKGNFGVIDQNGNWNILPEYDWIGWQKDGIRDLAWAIRNDTLVALEMLKANQASSSDPGSFAKHLSFEDDLAIFGDRWQGIVNSEGIVQFPPQPVAIERSESGYFQIKIGWRSGLINPQMKWIAKPDEFAELGGLIDQPKVEQINEEWLETTWVKGHRNKVGILSNQRELLVDTLFGAVLNDALAFSSEEDVCYWVSGFQENSWGIYSSQQGLVLDTIWEHPVNWTLIKDSNWVAIIPHKNKVGLISQFGDTLLPFVYTNLEGYNLEQKEENDWIEQPSLLANISEKLGLLSLSGQVLIPCEFEQLLDLNDGRWLGWRQDSLYVLKPGTDEVHEAFPLPLHHYHQKDLWELFYNESILGVISFEESAFSTSSTQLPTSWNKLQIRLINHLLLEKWLEGLTIPFPSYTSAFETERFDNWYGWDLLVALSSPSMQDDLRSYLDPYGEGESYRTAEVIATTSNTVSFSTFIEYHWYRQYHEETTLETYWVNDKGLTSLTLKDVFIPGFEASTSKMCLDAIDQLNESESAEENYEIDCSQPDQLILSEIVSFVFTPDGLQLWIEDSRNQPRMYYPEAEILLPWAQLKNWIDPKGPLSRFQ